MFGICPFSFSNLFKLFKYTIHIQPILTTMKSIKYIIVAFLMSSLAGFSQTHNSVVKKDKETESDSRQAGLKKLTDNAHRWNFDFDLDDEALEARIEQAVE